MRKIKDKEYDANYTNSPNDSGTRLQQIELNTETKIFQQPAVEAPLSVLICVVRRKWPDVLREPSSINHRYSYLSIG